MSEFYDLSENIEPEDIQHVLEKALERVFVPNGTILGIRIYSIPDMPSGVLAIVADNSQGHLPPAEEENA